MYLLVKNRDSKDNELWGFDRYFLKIADLPPNILSEIKWKSRSKSKSVQSQKLKKWFISLELLSKSHILSKARYLYHSKRFLLYFWKKKPKIQEKYISDFASKNNLRNLFLFIILSLAHFLSFERKSKQIQMLRRQNRKKNLQRNCSHISLYYLYSDCSKELCWFSNSTHRSRNI